MLGKKHSKERRLIGAAIVTLAISRLVGFLVLGSRALGHVVAARRALGAAGLSARQRFAAYADLEYAHEQALARRARRHLMQAEAT